jgi:pimeloyl-ACP methyl ester carboxylesterase
MAPAPKAVHLLTHPIRAGIVVMLLACAWAAAAAAQAEASSAISWSKCYAPIGPFECGTVHVPLDYDHPNDQQITIALTRLPATDPQHRIGSLFLNPGGPGGSGVDYVLSVGQSLYTDEVRARFDLVGFDPRGIGRSSGLRCFGTPKQFDPAFTPFAFPLTPAEESARRDADGYLANACAKRGTSLLDHMSTANVARDLDRMRAAVGDQQLSYAGVSYGSYLGVTYANMFPDRVRALVVDGVVDPIAWSTGRDGEAATLPFSTRLHSDAGAQATLNEFFRLCDAAGENCALSGDAAGRFAALAQRARQHPLQIVIDGFSFELDYSNLIGLTLSAMYSSHSWKDFADFLAVAETSPSPTALGARLRSYTRKYDQTSYPNFLEGSPAVGCEDSDNPSDFNAWSVAGAQADRSSYFGRIWTWAWSVCQQWPAHDGDRYVGPFTRTTANPVLVVGTKFDPATRYEGAVLVHDLLPRSELLTVNGWGHTSLFLSRCADEAIGRYLVNIQTPAPGTTCQQDEAPFTPVVQAADAARDQARQKAFSAATTQPQRGTRGAFRTTAHGPEMPPPAGPSNAQPSAATQDAVGVRVAADEQGDAVFAWSLLDQASLTGRVQVRARSSRGKLSPVLTVSDPSLDAFDAAVAVNDDGAALISWTAFDTTSGNATIQARMRSAGGALGPVFTVSDPSAFASEGHAVLDAHGAALLLWTSYDPSAGHVTVQSRTRSATGVLGPIVTVSDPSTDASQGQLAIDSHGHAVFAWTSYGAAPSAPTVQVRAASASGVLGRVLDLSDPALPAFEPKLAIDDAGSAVVEWLQLDTQARKARVQSRSLRGATLAPTVDVSDGTRDAWDASVALDDHGNATYAWWVVTPGGARVQTRSQSARGTLGSTSDASNPADDGYEPQLAIGDGGNGVLTWMAFDRRGVRVQARSRSANGALGPIGDVSPITEDAFGVQAALDGRDDAVIGWSALDATSYRVLGRTRSVAGALGPLASISTSGRDDYSAAVSGTP